jgi:hypothetical protein
MVGKQQAERLKAPQFRKSLAGRPELVRRRRLGGTAPAKKLSLLNPVTQGTIEWIGIAFSSGSIVSAKGGNFAFSAPPYFCAYLPGCKESSFLRRGITG